MKRIFCALTLLPLLAVAEDRGPAIPDYPTERIVENVHVIHGPMDMPNPENQGFMNNPGIVITDAGVVIIDPGSSVQSGEMVLRMLAKLTDQPVVAVFNTHIHGDHWLGNHAIQDAYPDVSIYGHPDMIKLIANGEGTLWVTLMDQMTKGKTLGTKAVAPNRAVNNGDEFRIGNSTFRVHHYGEAHTTSDLMIEVVEKSVVFLGDNVLNGRIPRVDSGSITGNIKACSKIVATGAKHYVPGHGKTGGQALVDTMRVYYDTLYSSVQALYGEGLTDFEMRDTISARLQAYADWKGFDVQLGKHISYAYLQVEAEAF
jgi:glyoxylase-like metal-dependent hydrolase (beta-lactamase superfamily II)